MMKSSKSLHRLASAVTAGAMMGAGGQAFAIDANTLVTNLVSSSAGFTSLINVLGYVGGSGLAVAGIFKLKAHVDQPANNPLKDGVMRLASGGALLALPFMTAVMQGSIAEGQEDTAATAANISEFSTFQGTSAGG